MNRSTKVILTNRSGLLRKHGRPGLTRIEGAIRRLVQADARRGFATRLVAIDSAADMKPFGRRVANRNDARQTKRAVDDVCRALQPEYLTILGAPDVVPHVRLRNPMAASRDEDRRIESDLPYACDKPYSTRIKDFLGPTRVLGRLPDIQGTGDTKHLLGLLEHARAWKSRPRSDYRNYFALSTASWRGSTATTTKKLFGEEGALRLSPSEGPYWTAGDLEGRIHVINCHGDTGAPRFFGEAEDDEYDQPSCHESVLLPGRVAPATVVAAECCYGAELYKPQKGKPAGICHAYLGEGAEAFFGSTTIAYGPSSGNNFADLICGHFLRRVLEGASVGRAALEARQEYIRLGGYMEMVDLKTVAQFILLGDPSIHPVLAAGTTSTGTAPARKARVERAVGARRDRRKRLARGGKLLGRTTACVASRPDAKATAAIRGRLGKLALRHGARAGKVESFRLHAPELPGRAKLGRRLAAGKAVFHLVGLEDRPRSSEQKRVVARRPSPGGRSAKPRRFLVVREVNNRFQKVAEAVRH